MQNLLRKLKNRFSKSKFSFGLDIGTSTVKLALLKFLDDKVELLDFTLETIQPDLMQTLKRVFQLQGAKKRMSRRFLSAE